jgi:hypothetical protein
MGYGRTAPAGSGRMPRLDPFALPVKFQADDVGADGQIRQVELHHDRVVVRRSVHGMRMAFSLPVRVFRGISLRLSPPVGDNPGTIAITLEHPDPQLSVPLWIDEREEDLIAAWRSWGRALCTPLLVADEQGHLREPFPHLGLVAIGAPTRRRRHRAAIAPRRPSILLRRKPGPSSTVAPVHRAEREIIARN